MSDSFSNWMPSLNLTGNIDNDDDQNSGPFLQNRSFVSRLSLFQNELNSLNQLTKLYRNIPVYGTGPLTDDEKREMDRRNNAFVPEPLGAENQQEENQRNANARGEL